MNKSDVERIINDALRDNKIVTIITNYGSTRFTLSQYQISFGATRLVLSWWQSSYDNIEGIVVDAKELPHSSISFGSDPEFFYVKDGLVVPSTEVVKPNSSGVITDGFQAEMNPRSNTCRYLAGKSIASSLAVAAMLGKDAGAEVSFEGAYVIDDKTWRRTPLQLRRFGCNPTLNAYDDKQKRVTGLREKFRAGGGHIHLGIPGLSSESKKEFVKLLDVVVGNTCVMFDIDPNQAIRRKNYGRAGEYREKSYGLEYRVPSNFWLKHYSLWSMVSGLCRNARQLVEVELADELMSRIDIDKVREAINTNNKELATETLDIVVGFFKEKKLFSESALCYSRADKFLRFAKHENPISLVVPKSHTSKDIIESWSNVVVGEPGFESMIQKLKV